MNISFIQQAKFISRKWMQTIKNNSNELPKVYLSSLSFRKARPDTKFECESCNDSTFAQFIAKTFLTDKLDAVDVSFNEEPTRTYKRKDFIEVVNNCYMDLSIFTLFTALDEDYIKLIKCIKELYVNHSRTINIQNWRIVCDTGTRISLQKLLKECSTDINPNSINISVRDRHIDIDARKYLEMFVEKFDFSLFTNLNMLNVLSFSFVCEDNAFEKQEQFTSDIIKFIQAITKLQPATEIYVGFPFSDKDKEYVNLIIKAYIKVSYRIYSNRMA